MKEKLLGKTPEELKQVALNAGLPAFAGKQIARWMYVSRVKSIDEMTNISKAGREKLSELYDLGVIPPMDCQISKDGTKKYLFPVTCARRASLGAYANALPSELETAAIEAVMIPDDDRKTLCVSSQSGCKMGCKFCMTGRQGFHGNLSVADILAQFIAIDEASELTNCVFMGMGEPLDNWENVKRAIEVLTADWGFGWSPKRITLSTIGVIPNLEKYLNECKCHLAVSLHNPIPEERLSMMPVQAAYPIRDVIGLIKQYDFSGQRRVSFEYTMFSGFNDDKVHADALYRLLKGLECRINLIRFHKIPDFDYDTSPDGIMEMFKNRLSSYGITCTIRASRGEDILAACGMLAGQHKEKDS
ncbi:MAG: 23S rRNA (adenine(2503)-C(2))-methyltransferase RlmN [Bacteroidales bacterium]|nr:23S rRNA (adenine(2503)-C(2))-methyltransferase RlmN [Bacteroidales bacterium]